MPDKNKRTFTTLKALSPLKKDNFTVIGLSPGALAVLSLGYMMARKLDPQLQGRLLIIDDETDLREVLIALLEDSVLEIHQAANGAEGIAKLQSLAFDAVLSDEKMPKKTGLEVLKWMRENNLQIPFIIHTGYGQKETIAEAQRLGVYAFIDKPWDEKLLINKVQAAIRQGISQKS